MAHKEIWFVRHTDTVTPGDYDFDLSRKGKREARMLGWYLAAQKVATPVVVMQFRCLRAKHMAENLTSYLRQDPAAKVVPAFFANDIMPNHVMAFPRFLGALYQLDDVGEHFGGEPPSTAILVAHRAYDASLNFLRFFLSQDAKEAVSEVCPDAVFDQVVRKFVVHSRHQLKYGEVVRMRFPFSTWREIEGGSGEVVAQTTPRGVRPAFKAARRIRQQPR